MHNTAQSPDFLGFNRAETIMGCEYTSGMQCNISKIIQMPWNDQYGNAIISAEEISALKIFKEIVSNFMTKIWFRQVQDITD